MNKRKLLKRIFQAANFLAFIILIGLVILQHHEIKKLTTGSPEQTLSNNEPAVGQEYSDQKITQILKNGTVSDSDELEALRYQLQATEEELGMVQEDLNEELDRQAELARLQRELNKQMSSSPDSTKQVREFYESQYADFFKAFNISPENSEAYVDILVSYSSAAQEIYLEAQEVTNPTETDRNRFKQIWQVLDAEFETNKKDLLGVDVYQEMKTFMARQSSEQYWNNFSAVLGSDEKLTDTQQTALVEALVKAKEKLGEEDAAENDESERTYTFPSEASYYQEQLNQTIEYNRHRNEAYIEAAQSILSHSQIERLKAYQEQQLDMLTYGMKMTALQHGYDYEPEGETDNQE